MGETFADTKLHDFLLNGCSAREEDRHHALVEAEAWFSRMKRLEDAARTFCEAYREEPLGRVAAHRYSYLDAMLPRNGGSA